MKLGTKIKQPADTLDYDINCLEWIGQSGDTIISATLVDTPTGLTVGAIVVSPTRVKIWLSGGVNGATYKLEVTLTTAGGRVKQVEFYIRCKEY